MNNPFTKRRELSTPHLFMQANPPKNKYWLHLLLFILTLLTTTLAGAELITGRTMEQLNFFEDFSKGLPYSLAFLCFLTFHEFGHYFTAVYHGVKCSLPYYIPLYLPFSIFNIGSMGAVIRMRQTPDSTRKYFDIGIAGPLAGFVVSVILLWYGFSSLPEPDYLHGIHPEYREWFGNRMPSDSELQGALSSTGAVSIELGNSLIFQLFKYLFADPARLPGAMELYHYPFVFVGYLTLFFTALNLLPIGQLDGGHVTYGLLGRRRAAIISRVTVFFLIGYGGLGLVDYESPEFMVYLGLYLLYVYYVMTKILGSTQAVNAFVLALGLVGLQYLLQTYTRLEPGGTLWLVYSFIAVRVIRLDHPPAYVEEPLDRKRKILGGIAMLIFVMCFTPNPLKIVIMEPPLPGDAPEEKAAEEVLAAAVLIETVEK
jgi:membrane-associated protease RseP (regulator of RpoE activity)